jgi:nitrate reductase delta subunit
MKRQLWLLAEAFCYPNEERKARLEEGIRTLPAGSVRMHLESFLKGLSRYSLGEWEEVFTRTLELNPICPPYLGYLIWGDSHSRGKFMAELKPAMREAGIELDGELPDHIVPVLRYLDQANEIHEELEIILAPAVQSMVSSLAEIDPENLYLEPLAAVLETTTLGNGGIDALE